MTECVFLSWLLGTGVSPLYTAVFLLCRLFALPYYVTQIGVRALLGRSLRLAQPVWARVWVLFYGLAMVRTGTVAGRPCASQRF